MHSNQSVILYRFLILYLWISYLTLSSFIACESPRKIMLDTENMNSPITMPTQSPLIALTPKEYNHTISDLLGLPRNGNEWPTLPNTITQIVPPAPPQFSVFGQMITPVVWPWEFPHEEGVNGFEGMATGQTPSPYLIEQLQRAALHFASYIFVSPIFFTCDQWEELATQEAQNCAWESIVDFAQRAWRRPLSQTEEQRLQQSWQRTLQQHNIQETLIITVASLLQSPHFLYKIETGKQAKHQVLDTESHTDQHANQHTNLGTSQSFTLLTGWEMASRLSYFLWDSMPDADLFQAAAEGRLSSKEDIVAQAKRMLADPKARESIISFHRQLLHIDLINTINPARRAHASLFNLSPMISDQQDCDLQWPAVVGPIRASMEAETDLFIERTILDGVGTFKALMTDHHGYLSDATRFIYGDEVVSLPLPSIKRTYFNIVASGASNQQLSLSPVEFPSTQRAGILTLPSVLAIQSYAVHPAPIRRGKMILERLACQTLGDPPPGAEAVSIPDTEEAEGSNRQRTEHMTSSPACTACHDVLNPPGFAFENYDVFGRWRAEDHAIPVDATGSFTLAEGETFSFINGVDLAHQLAESTQVQNCYVSHWTRYAVGYELADTHQGLQQLQDEFRVHGHIPTLLQSIVSSDLFRYLKTNQVQGAR